MKDIDQTRRENLKLLELETGSPTSAAKLAGMSLAQFANLREGAKDSKTGKPRGMRKETARKIEANAGKPAGWLDVDHSNARPERASNTSPAIARPWPFPSIPEADIRALDRVQIGRLEGAMALVIAQLKMPVKVIPPRQAATALVDINAAADEFPMDIPGLPGPREVGAGTASRKTAPLVSGAVDNIRPAVPYPANDEMVDVPELGDVRLAANIEGHENETEHQTGVMQFRKSFLQSVGADGGRGRVVYAKGDSMEPIIGDGSALLVVLDEHLTVRDLAVGGIYAIRYDGKTMVKKVVKDKLTGHWVARSFNHTYGDVSLENGVPVRVLGRVVWAGTKLA